MFDPNKIKVLQEDSILVKKIEIKEQKYGMIDVPLGSKSFHDDWLAVEIIKMGERCSRLKEANIAVGSKVLINVYIYGDDFERFGDYIIIPDENWIWAEII